MVTLTTHGIKITVISRYEKGASNPALKRYIHSYIVKIENQSSRTIKLLSRYWLITEGDGTKKVVTGEGVVGEQPILMPGEVHTYSSWCPLSLPNGKMEGHYKMKDLDDGQMIQVLIPAFILTADYKQN
ncbi:MAG TPA: Co2+/Mg2+ efflux protein ApaG [Saprospiraceae bacterium]|nr:Co2+/Mg2+ efflux protein ApaG [Saprospiraceae bacterium]